MTPELAVATAANRDAALVVLWRIYAMALENTMRICYSYEPQNPQECEWCHAEITHITTIIENDGTQHTLGPECGEKAAKAIYAREFQNERADAERQRIAAARREYARRFPKVN